MLLRAAHTMMNTPALSTIDEAAFLIVRRLDFHSMGSGIISRHMSVATLVTNVTQMMGFDTAAWHLLPGSGLICQ